MDYSLYEELRNLCIATYNKNTYKNWKVLSNYSDTSGVYIKLFQRNDKVVFAIRGTEIPQYNDFKADLVMKQKQIPPGQAYRAQQFYETIKNKYNVIFTGHSLGGSIAQYLGQKYGNTTVTFAAYGLKSNKNCSNIVNFGCELDPVFISNIDHQSGSVYILPDPKFKQSIKYTHKLCPQLLEHPYRHMNILHHFLENWPPLNTAIKYK